MPYTYKLFHVLTVHHEHFICKAKNTKHLHKYYKDCPIEKFTYFSFTDSKTIKTPTQSFVFFDYKISSYNFLYVKNINKNIKLRAPPLC